MKASKKVAIGLLAVLLAGCSRRGSNELNISLTPDESRYDRTLDTRHAPIAPYFDASVYELASVITGAPAHILFGIACVESDQMDWAIGDQGRSLGRFQINETFREHRVKKYGEYDPHDPYDAAIIAGRIYMDYLRVLNDEVLAICAYRQGVGGVLKNGPTTWYSDKVYYRIRKGA